MTQYSEQHTLSQSYKKPSPRCTRFPIEVRCCLRAFRIGVPMFGNCCVESTASCMKSMNMMCEYWQSLIVDGTYKSSFRNVYHLG